MSQDAKEGDDGLNLKFHTKLLPKTVAEIEEVHARVRKLFVRKRTKAGHTAIQKPKVKTAAERKIEATQRQKDIKDYSKSIGYSKYYYDEQHEYRHVVLPKILAKWLPHAGLLKEEEWSSLGVSQSSGWQHYMVYAPEPHILLFRREKDYLAKVSCSLPTSTSLYLFLSPYPPKC
ncbi:regulatory subunit of cyclin-dependent kinase [Mucor mucedo]|uniref:regulatory subunit of cyclin-dependent kinase n=1 Tax=Mucor mucedo TaxID=29922 RepID=UPI00221FBEF1|nr:regulatory subunit of cyclin-dependent kinase [Mucor mucedo]KAI7895768.1 regulatory subunit of cyclin-dependent kinase [Mucor mucedo]